MELKYFRESQWSDSDNTGTAMLFEEYLLEQIRRVQQPPKMRKNIAVPLRGKIDLSEKTDRVQI